MSRQVSVLVLLPTFLLIGGCGGSSHSSSTTSTQQTATQPPATTAGRTATAPAQTNTGTTRSGSTNARVPATFTIRAGGKLDPKTVSSPAFIAVQLSAVSADGKAHTLRAQGRTLHVPAGGRAQTMLAGMRAGTYPVTVDGVRRGALLIGGEPGP